MKSIQATMRDFNQCKFSFSYEKGKGWEFERDGHKVKGDRLHVLRESKLCGVVVLMRGDDPVFSITLDNDGSLGDFKLFILNTK